MSEPTHREIKKDIERVESDVHKLEASFAHHLTIYAQNGKESARLAQEVSDLKHSFEVKTGEILSIIKTNQKTFARKDDIKPLKNIVYGAVGLILTAFVVAITGIIFI